MLIFLILFTRILAIMMMMDFLITQFNKVKRSTKCRLCIFLDKLEDTINNTVTKGVRTNVHTPVHVYYGTTMVRKFVVLFFVMYLLEQASIVIIGTSLLTSFSLLVFPVIILR